MEMTKEMSELKDKSRKREERERGTEKRERQRLIENR
jgi:hypothetical protein